MASNTKSSGQDNHPTRHFGRGFASMDPERQREIATHRPVPDREAANEDPADEAREAGRKASEGAAAQPPRQQKANPAGTAVGKPAGGVP